MTYRTKTILDDHRVRFFWILVSLSILSFCFYIYAINAIARNVATRGDWERQITKISASLDSLEFSYIERKNGVTIELATEYGFREVKNPLFVSRVPKTSLSFNTLNR